MESRWSPSAWRRAAVAQRPPWPDPGELAVVADELRRRPALTAARDVLALRARMADVATGRALVLHGGDCAEPMDATAPADALARAATLDELAAEMEGWTGMPVVRIGRFAGQFGKPRSAATEVVGGLRLTSYRGDIVNGPDPTPGARIPDARRLAAAYDTSRAVLDALACRDSEVPVWTSHEALILEYEQALTRHNRNWTLCSTHFPWIGERTRRPDGAHVRHLSGVVNPVGVKIGPSTTPGELLELCAALDPDRRPGRLTLIARMGAGRVGAALPILVRVVRAAGHPVVWMCDPMHGNTVRTASGRKTRVVGDVVTELARFVEIVRFAGCRPAGVHLEFGDPDLDECVEALADGDREPVAYRTRCDPRLSAGQAHQVLAGVRHLFVAGSPQPV